MMLSKVNWTVLAAGVFAVVAWAAASPRAMAQAFSFSPGNLSYSENFDGMGAGTVFIPGWTSTDSTMSVSSGTSGTGSIYNVGPSGGTDRAFGSLASGTTIPIFGASFANITGATIDSLVFVGVMEQWRTGNNAVVEELPFEFSLDATSLADGTWVSASSFNFVEKLVASTTSGAVDGNLDANRTAISTRTNLSWNAGTTMWIRWSDTDNFGTDGLYAIDDFALSVRTAAAPLYWDLNGNTPGLGGTLGTWDSSTPNWTPDPTGSSATQAFNSENAAHFSGRAGTVQIAPGGITATGGVTFASRDTSSPAGRSPLVRGR